MKQTLLRSMADGLRKPPANLKAFLDAREEDFDHFVRETVEGSGEWRDLTPREEERRYARSV